MDEITVILGRADQEMRAIEWVANQAGFRVCKGLHHEPNSTKAVRVTAWNAYQVNALECGGHVVNHIDVPVVLVETGGAIFNNKTVLCRCDHHRPGDYGYGKPPEQAFAASSLGQFINFVNYIKGRTVFGPDTLIDLSYIKVRAAVVAASDHCLSAAYQGRVPNVSPEEIIEFRDANRARTYPGGGKEYRAALQQAFDFVANTPIIPEFPGTVHDARQYYLKNKPVKEANEASFRMGIPLLFSLPQRSLHTTKTTLVNASSDQVNYFFTPFAQKLGLTHLYGDPARGFAGGYDARGMVC